jgi:hypothetical protein
MLENRCWIAVVVGIFLLGCTSKPSAPAMVEAEGIVLLDNQPLKRVRLRFIPAGVFAQEYTASGVSDDAGKFTLACHGRPGVVIGDNVVIVEESEVPEHLKLSNGRLSDAERFELNKYYDSLGGRPLPRRYTNLATTPLTVNVTADQQSYKLFLTVDPLPK